jgi:hypothetical protein
VVWEIGMIFLRHRQQTAVRGAVSRAVPQYLSAQRSLAGGTPKLEVPVLRCVFRYINESRL